MLMSLLFIIDLSAQPQSSFNKPTNALPSPQHTAKQREREKEKLRKTLTKYTLSDHNLPIEMEEANKPGNPEKTDSASQRSTRRNTTACTKTE